VFENGSKNYSYRDRGDVGYRWLVMDSKTTQHPFAQIATGR